MMSADNKMTINLLLLGRTQSGKSATGNTLLGSIDFASCFSPHSVTTSCYLGRSCHISGFARRQGGELSVQVCVLDTPGYPHSNLSRDQVQHEVKSALVHHFGKTGLHLALLVLRVDIPLCELEEEPTVQLVQELLGPTWKSYTVILFTHADSIEKASFSPEQYLHAGPETLHKLVHLVDRKYIFVDNCAKILKQEGLKALGKIMEFLRQNRYQPLQIGLGNL